MCPRTRLALDKIVSKIRSAKSLLLSTHRECDGDGLGAQIALYHALKKIGKQVRVLNVDDVPTKYGFLKVKEFVEIFLRPHTPIEPTDLTLIFDTNDHRQLGPLFPELEKRSKEIIFVDHHPVLEEGPHPTAGSFIDTKAASTGEIAYKIIKALGVELDRSIAQALYTSVAFDTQVFRYIRNSPESHKIAAELVTFPIEPEDIHRRLFSTHTVEKIAFLSKMLSKIEYHIDGRVALLKMRERDLRDHGLTTDETRDVIDMIMNIESIEAAVLFREDKSDLFKISLRSKGRIEVLSVAEIFGGGGHRWAAGATVTGEFENLKEQAINGLKEKLRKRHGSSKK